MVVNRRSQDGHWRRRRMLPPSSVVRESSTLESVLRQYGQCIADSSLWIDLRIRLWAGRKLVDQSVYFLGTSVKI